MLRKEEVQASLSSFKPLSHFDGLKSSRPSADSKQLAKNASHLERHPHVVPHKTRQGGGEEVRRAIKGSKEMRSILDEIK